MQRGEAVYVRCVYVDAELEVRLHLVRVAARARGQEHAALGKSDLARPEEQLLLLLLVEHLDGGCGAVLAIVVVVVIVGAIGSVFVAVVAVDHVDVGVLALVVLFDLLAAPQLLLRVRVVERHEHFFFLLARRISER